jgi:hypothetical protein
MSEKWRDGAWTEIAGNTEGAGGRPEVGVVSGAAYERIDNS